jgi:hypothetical protein
MRSFVICRLFFSRYWNDQIKEGEMIGARRSREGNDKCIKVLDRKLVGKRPSEKSLDLDGKVLSEVF